MCRNVPGDFRCECNDGFYDTKSSNFTKDPNCADINECSLVNVNYCLPTEECINTPGSYYCKCKTGCDNTTTTTTTTTKQTTLSTGSTTLATQSTLGFTAYITDVVIITKKSIQRMITQNDEAVIDTVKTKVNSGLS